jgi:TP901 family phage tail tape measure protein
MTLAQLIVKLGADTSDFQAKLTGAGKHWRRVGTQMSSLGSKLSVGISLPLAAMGTVVAKAAIDFESAFAGVRKTVDASEKEFAQLSSGIRKMATEVPAAAGEIAKVTEAAGQLGIENKNLLSFTRTMVDLGNTTNLSGDQAATALARLANITQMPQEQFQNLGSTIVALGNNLATTEAEIVEMGLRISGAGHVVGLTVPQVMGFAAALSSVGVEAQAGGTSISKVMIQIANSVASNTKELKTFAGVAGMSVKEFKDLFQKDAAGAIISVITGLNRMQKAGENVFAVLDELGFSEIRVRDALLRAAGAGDLFNRSVELGSKAWQENTAMTEEARKRYETTASQLKIFWNQLQDIAITIGNALLPMLKRLVEMAQPAIEQIKKMAEWFKNLNPQIQTLIVGAVALLAALGPIIFVAAKVTAAFGALAGVFAMMMGPVGVIALFVIALVSIADSIRGIIAANREWQDSVAKTASWVEKARGGYEALADSLIRLAGATSLASRMMKDFGRVEAANKLLQVSFSGTDKEVRAALKSLGLYGGVLQNERAALQAYAKEERDIAMKSLAVSQKAAQGKIAAARSVGLAKTPGGQPAPYVAEGKTKKADTSALEAWNEAYYKSLHTDYQNEIYALDQQKKEFEKVEKDKTKIAAWYNAEKRKIDLDYAEKQMAVIDAAFKEELKTVVGQARMEEAGAKAIEEEKRRVVLAGITDRYQLQAAQAKDQAEEDIANSKGTEDQKAEYAVERQKRLQMDLATITREEAEARAKEEERIAAESADKYIKIITHREDLTKEQQILALQNKQALLEEDTKAYEAYTNAISALQDNLDITLQDKWRTTLESIKVMFGEWGETVSGFVSGMTDAFSSGLGNVLVGLQSFGDFFTGLFNTLRQMIAQVIADIVKKWIMGILVQKLATVKKGMAEIGTATAAAMAWAIASQAMLGPLGLATGPALAAEYAALIAATTAPVIGGVAALAEGGIVTEPTMALIGEAGPEAVIPLGKAGGAITVQYNHYGDIKTDMDVALLKKDLAETIEGAIRGA